MKKIIFVIVLTILSLGTSAQEAFSERCSLVRTGVYFRFCKSTQQTDVFLLQEDNDTTLNGLRYFKVVHYTDDFSIVGYLREEGSRVYILFEGDERESLLYDFGLEVGESIDVGLHGDSHYVTVVNVDTIFLQAGGNEGYARRLQITDSDIKESGYVHPAYWVEGIGSDLGILSPYGWGRESDYKFDRAGDYPAFTYADFFQNPKDFSFVNGAPLWYVVQTYIDNAESKIRTLWFYIPEKELKVVGDKCYKQMYFGRLRDEECPEGIPATCLFGIREEDGRVYVDLEQYKEGIALFGLGNIENIPYEITADGEMVLYDFNMQVVDSFRPTLDNPICIDSIGKTYFNRRVYYLDNGISFSEGRGAINAPGALVAYLNPPAIQVTSTSLVIYGKNGVYVNYYAAGGGELVEPPIVNRISSISPLNPANINQYDLSGRKLPSLQGGAGGRLPKGVYIQGGKKFVVK